MITRSFNEIDLDLATVEAEIAGVIIQQDSITSDTLDSNLVIDGNGTGLVATTKTFASLAPQGSAPFLVQSTTKVTNLNSDLLDGQHLDTAATPDTAMGRDINGDTWARIFNGEATSAQYADLAENYLADKVYVPGTVMAIGGENEITKFKAGMPLAGVISTNPGLKINDGKEQKENDLYQLVALKGKIPVFIEGEVKKGDYVIASDDGKGKVSGTFIPEFHIGVALEDSKNATVMVKV